MRRAWVAFVLSIITLAAFAFSMSYERPCASVAGMGQLVAFTSEPPPGWEFCTPEGIPAYSQVGETDGGLTGPVQPGG